MKSFFVFDVESIGLHGEGFAVGGGLFLENGAIQWGFCFSCPTSEADGDFAGRAWVNENMPQMQSTHRYPRAMRDAFWQEWMKAKTGGALMAADCLWPVEARFIKDCIADEPKRTQDGPYPFVEISSILLAAGMDPVGTYDRTESELPAHDPYADAVQSARLLSEALDKIKQPTNA